MTAVAPDPTKWRVVRAGNHSKPYAIRLGPSGPYLVGKPSLHHPNGAIITFATDKAAQRRADQLNQENRK